MIQCFSRRPFSSCRCVLPAVSQFPDLEALSVHVVESMLKALKMTCEEARLRFPRLLQIIELYPSETLDVMTKEVRSPDHTVYLRPVAKGGK